jgi:hypothetical protein
LHMANDASTAHDHVIAMRVEFRPEDRSCEETL